jgi:tryptophan-rich sensory protein
MDTEKEIREIREQLNRVETKVDAVLNSQKYKRPTWVNISIGFSIVLILIYITAGIIGVISK